MKQIYRCGGLLLSFIFGFAGFLWADQKPVIQVLDSLVIDLSRMDSTICIANSVHLSFDNDSIFACEWVDMATGQVFSNEKSLTVSPKNTSQYQVTLYYFTGELIKNGDFEDEEANKHIYTEYTWGEKKWVYDTYYTDELWFPGHYRIGKCPHDFHRFFSYIRDHTPSMNGNGNMMCVNGAATQKVVYRTKVDNLKIGTTYAFSTWGSAIGRDNPSKFHFTINGAPLGPDFRLTNLTDLKKGIWQQFYELWVADKTEATIALVNLETEENGNDFAIDDISFASMEKKTGVITVNVLPNVELGDLPDQEICEGNEIAANAKAFGTDIQSYRWMKDGRPLELTTPELYIPEAGLQDSGLYTCTVTGKCGPKDNTFRVEVREKLRAEKLRDTVWPCEESRVVLDAGVRGYAPVYRWSAPKKSRGWEDDKKGKYTNPSVRWNRDAGTYLCRVSNFCGSLQVYKVLKPGQHIRITEWPEDCQVCTGTFLDLEVVTEPEAARIQWSGPGIYGTVSGEKIALKDIQENQAGVYYCRVEDTCGVSDQRSVILRVTPPLSLVDAGRDTAVCEQGRAVFRGRTDGIKPRYHWSGPHGFTAETADIVIEPVTATRTGVYTLTVTDSCGVRLTDQVKLALLKEYDLLNITPPQTVCPGDDAVLEVEGGSASLSYVWTYPSGKQVAGARLPLKSAEPGEYVCRISGICPAVSRKTQIAWNEPLKTVAGENKFRVCEGTTVCFRPDIRQGEKVKCEWWTSGRKNGEAPEWCMPAVTTADGGDYECRISSVCGDTLLNYRLELKEPVKITGYLPDRYVRPGEQVTLFVNASGAELSYEWLEAGRLLKGEQENRLQVTAPQTEGITEYTCRISGCNTESATIRVHVRNYINLRKDTTVVLCAGQNYSYRAEDKSACPEGAQRQYWLYLGKDTVAHGAALNIADFRETMAGEYIYTQEGSCGKEQLHLQVESAGQPVLVAIRCTEAVAEQEGRLTVCEGENIGLSAEVKANGLLTYEWSKDGRILPGQQGASLTLPDVTAGDEGKYTCRVISAVCGEDSKDIYLQVNRKLKVTEMDDLVLCPGEEALLRVNTEASAPSEFIWDGPERVGWTARSDGYGTTYRKVAVDAASDGIYTCLVVNSCGKELAEIRLKVEQQMDAPDLPREDTLCPGVSACLHIQVEQSDVKYTWTLPDERVVEGEYLSIPAFSAADTGLYRYQVKTKYGCFSREGTVHLLMRRESGPLRLTPVDTAVCKGRDVYLEAEASGERVRYEWRGPQGFQAEGKRIHISSVTEETSGVYEVFVSDICHTNGMWGQVQLTLLKEFEDLTISRDTGICTGGEARFVVTGGTEGLTYEWMLNGRILSREARLRIPAARQEEAGLYVCRIRGNCQQVEEQVNLKVYPLLRARKVDFAPVCEREDARLEVEAVGEQLGYRWTREGVEKGYRTERLDLYDVIPADEGLYECQVTSLCGDTTLQYAFRLKEKTRVLRYAADRILCEDDAYDLFVEASGENNHYEWSCNGVVLPETADVVHCPATGKADTLLYTCRVEGDCGKDSASIRIIVGEFRKVWGDRKDTLCEGSNYKYNADVLPPGAFDGLGFDYEWTFRGKVVSTVSLLAFEDVKPEKAGDYYCRIRTRPGAPVESEATVKLTIELIRQPRLDAIPADLYVVEGSDQTFRVEARGDELEYTWMKDGEMADHPAAEWSFHPIVYEDRGNYRVTVSNQCGRVSGELNVEVWRKTVIVYPQERDDSVCLNGMIELDVLASGEKGLLYKWYLEGKAVDAPYTQPLLLGQVTREDQGTYLCVVSGRGGTDSCKIHLKVLGLPEITDIQGKFHLCRDDSELLQFYTASCNEKRVDYLWTVEGGEIRGGINGEGALIYWDVKKEGEIRVKLTSLTSGCSDQKQADIRWNAVPDVYFVVPDEVGYCQDTLKLDKAYPWGGDFYVNGLLSGGVRFTDKTIVYTVRYQYTDAVTGCTGWEENRIGVASAPVVRLAADTVISGWCAPVVLEIAEHSEGDILWVGVPALDVSDVYRAIWQPEKYTVEKYNFRTLLTDRYGCRAEDSVLVSLLPSPQVELRPDTTIGICNPLVLRASWQPETAGKVQWEPAASLEVLSPDQAELVDKWPGTYRFSIAVTDAYGCVGTDTVEVSVEAAPAPESREVCLGDSLLVDAGNYPEYSWTDGYPDQIRVLKLPGNYQLDVRDQHGCPGSASYCVHALPEVRLPDTLIFEDQEMIFSVPAEGEYGPYEAEWQDGSGGYTYTATEEGYYSVRLTDVIGCTSADTAFLEVRKKYIAAPDAFLPNSSGENSRFYLKEVNFADQFEMYIYDRWGELLFKTSEIGFNGGWDGMFKGIHCQPGAYVWVAYVNGKEVGRGTVMLVR